MLTIYRRHTKRCPHREEGRGYRRCKCPIWVQGTIGGRTIRESLKISNWEKAQAHIREWEAEGQITEQPEITIEVATDEHLADLNRRHLARDTVRKYELLFRELKAFAKDHGLRFLSELDLPMLRKFYARWSQSPITAKKKDERVKSFFRHAFESKWIDENPAWRIKGPKVKLRPTLPFSREEMLRILEACGPTPEHTSRMRAYLARMKAFVLLLRYSGLRLGDAARLPKDRIRGSASSGYKLLLYTQKTGVPVHVPLPAFVVEALESIRHANGTYFFWSGTSDANGYARAWGKYLRRLFRLAKIRDGHAHRFRDTFAVELLQEGVGIEQVSVLLGHSSVRITERHYAPWVQARQARLEAEVERALQKDPVAFAQTKGTLAVHGKSGLPN